jgi:hypothetical protein
VLNCAACFVSLQLLEDPEEKISGKRARKDVLRQFSFSETFGAKSGQRQKKPRLSAEDFGSLVQMAQAAEESYADRAGESGQGDAYANKDEHEFASVRVRSRPFQLQSRSLFP